MTRKAGLWQTWVLAGALTGALVGFAACGDPEQPAPEDMTPTMENVQTLVFDQCCATSGCHNDETQAGGLNLADADVSHLALVDIASENAVARENGWRLVTPGDPERSFIIRKLVQPGLGEGAPMPVGQKQLNEPYIQMLTAWIEQGAQR